MPCRPACLTGYWGGVSFVDGTRRALPVTTRLAAAAHCGQHVLAHIVRVSTGTQVNGEAVARHGGVVVLAEVREQVAQGRNAGLSGTPTFFVNGKLLPSSHPLFVEAAIRWELTQLGEMQLPEDTDGVFPR